eukprot:m.133107 g.133107  ORF g.133107 m.133107 type:complete len:2201 (-) comp11351_c0_seq1:387-6989(-)
MAMLSASAARAAALISRGGKVSIGGQSMPAIRTLYTVKRTPAKLELEDGSVFNGYAFGAIEPNAGEVVFNTSMTSYPDSLTDPSYKGQILTSTYPLIGNFGVPDHKEIDEYGLIKNLESDQIHVSGLVVQEYSEHYNHFEATQSLSDWMENQGIPGITGVDTRAVTKRIRQHGSMLGRIIPATYTEEVPFQNPNERNLIAEVSRTAPVMYSPPGGGDITILAVDCGIKMNIIRELLKRGANVKVVPWDYDVNSEQWDGLFYSNGPGDPSMAGKTVEHLRTALQGDAPIFGICMGHQLMSLAAGATTSKMAFGNRGQNIPTVNLEDGRCYITPQNHGYAVDADSFPPGWKPLFTNTNDGSNEGCRHESKPFMSVQFHPEAHGGPQDTRFLFDAFISQVRQHSRVSPLMSRAAGPSMVADGNIKQCFKKQSSRITFPAANTVPHFEPLNKVLVLGSGGLMIGQAGEFDYSGSQAIKALKDKGIKSVLINPNIATVQTAEGLADECYLLPVTPDFVEEVIRKEKPDGIFLQFGGQTALNCGIELDRRGVLKHHGVRVLGTTVPTIIATEDREIFANKLLEIGEHIAPSIAATTTTAAVEAANKIGYPVIVRTAFSLGGLGSGFAHDDNQLRQLCSRAFSQTPQVLVEKSLKGWKEVEYEVVRDAFDNTITVCNMENFDPLGVHTGESIVVAPSQTLSDEEYNMLRTCAIKVVKHIGIVGECNIQYALNPDSKQYYIIEVNARLSRSSALASKATGYPLAYVAAKLALNQSLPSLRNAVTKKTTACFEPSLDYCVVKVPRWDLNKFPGVNRRLGTAMKSVGEVMAIGRTFPEAFQKAVRMLDIGADGFEPHRYPATDSDLENPTDVRFLCLATALAEGYTVDRLYELTKIDRWFLSCLEKISKQEVFLKSLTAKTLVSSHMLASKKLGFSDKKIASLIGSNEIQVRNIRKGFGIRPRVKQIDTVAAEYPAQTNYLYLTYHGTEDDIDFPGGHAMVLGSGVYRIGSSVEFDYCAVGCVRELRNLGHKTIMLNYNPETVSTDYDECSRMYFDQLTFETTMDVYELENPTGLILSMGGQIPNNMAMDLFRQRVRIFGTSPEMIDGAENRFKFSRMCDANGIDQPKWKELTSVEAAHEFCNEVTYPCLMRPSYILSGVGMRVVYSKNDLEANFKEAAVVSRDYPVVISKFITGAKEVEVDAVARKGEILVFAISEHVENAGIHSGDATIIHPPQDLTHKTQVGVEKIARQVAKALKINGPMNIQFIAKDDKLKVIECNVRVSRSFPFVSKTMGVDLIKIATQVMIGMEPEIPTERRKIVGVKVPQFSFSRLAGADPTVGVDMISTGEVACFGQTKEEAYLKALMSTSFKLPKNNVLLSIGGYADKAEFAESAKMLHEMGYTLWGSVGTADYYSSEHGIPITDLSWLQEDEVVIADEFAEGNFDLVINVSMQNKRKVRRPAMGAAATFGYLSRRGAVDHKVPLITDIKCAKLFVRALQQFGHNVVVGPVDCTRARECDTLPSLVATNVNMGNVAKTSRRALAGGFTVALAVHPNVDTALEEFASAVVDVAVIVDGNAAAASSDGPTVSGSKSLNSTPGRAVKGTGARPVEAVTRALTESTAQAPVAVGHLTTLTGDASDGTNEILQRIADSLLPESLMIVDAGAANLNSVLLFAMLNGREIHVTNVRSTAALRLIRKAKAKGINVTCSVSLSTLFSADVDPETESFWSLAKDIDVVTIAHDDELDGASELEIALPLLFGAVADGKISKADIIRWLSSGPAEIFNIELDPTSYTEVDTLVDHSTLHTPLHRGCRQPFASARLCGRVTRTVVHDEALFVDGAVFATDGVGHVLSPSVKEGAVIPTASTLAPAPTPAGGDASGGHASDDEFELSAAASQAMGKQVRELLVKSHILNVKQFTREMLHVIFDIATKLKLEPNPSMLQGKVLASIFYEPSTRTSCSFTSAMQQLGGTVIPIHEVSKSSVAKGESLHDFIRTMECYADVIVLRHPEQGAVAKAAACSVDKPIVNAGDGTGEHPTQALLDVYTIREELGTVNNLTITMLGDLKHGRTVHSLARMLSLYKVKINYVSPKSLAMPQEIMDELKAAGVEQTVNTEIDAVIGDTDVLYVTRLQRERFENAAEADSIGRYTVDTKLLSKAKNNMILMHPLPRVDEISPDVDSDKRAAYFRQMQNGVYVRMALLSLVLGTAEL